MQTGRQLNITEKQVKSKKNQISFDGKPAVAVVAEWSKALSQMALGPRFESPVGITILIAQK